MLKGKTALVTGGARGIGAAICRKLASMGADIAIVDLQVTEQAQQLQEAIAAEFGVRAQAYACNVSDQEQCKATVKQVIADLGNVTILVNNAGITRDALILGMKEADFDAVISTNLKGTFNMTQACYRPFMKQKYGKIINLASVSGLLGTAGQANYAASKAGVMALTKVTARELGSRGVTCNAIAPGFIATDMTKEISEEATKNYLESIPMGRAGQPEDVANLAGFLASPDSDYLTGTVIRIDGGLAIS
ncbi:MAG: 3-oxoacyl-[acyl-carrier-protein] reductase [Oscillospiraceae bacterium]|nr:3-oxoacyl-[acyl-carrier-protein] reductase [Oscillospiraceae bacterium]MCR4760055.1 3-oxoacyl-[acyl-carrier-protein] reductase [Oscillospiraceae bacterium]